MQGAPALAGLAAVMALASGARAEPDKQASEFFRAGEASYARGDFPAAARSFEEAHRRAPHGATLYNAGLAWELAKEATRAADDYEAALKRGGLSALQTSDATARLGALEKRLAHIAVVAPRAGVVSVAHLEQATVPIVLHVAPGEQQVRVHRRDGKTETRTVTAAIGQTVEVAFDPEPAPTPAVETSRDTAPVAPEPDHRRAWGWAALGTSLGLGGVAVYLGLEALSAKDVYDGSGYTDLDAYHRAATLRTWTNVFWIGAGLAGAAGVTLMLGAPARAATADRTSVRLRHAAIVTPSSMGYRVSF